MKQKKGEALRTKRDSQKTCFETMPWISTYTVISTCFQFLSLCLLNLIDQWFSFSYLGNWSWNLDPAPWHLARGIVTIHRGGQTDPSRALASGVNWPPLLHVWRFQTDQRYPKMSHVCSTSSEKDEKATTGAQTMVKNAATKCKTLSCIHKRFQTCTSITSRKHLSYPTKTPSSKRRANIQISDKITIKYQKCTWNAPQISL